MAFVNEKAPEEKWQAIDKACEVVFSRAFGHNRQGKVSSILSFAVPFKYWSKLALCLSVVFYFLFPNLSFAKNDNDNVTEIIKNELSKSKIESNTIADQAAKSYKTQKKILAEFEAIFQRHVWEIAGYPSVRPLSEDFIKTVNQPNFPSFLRGFSLREKGMPKYGVVNKWNKKNLDVTFGWTLLEFPKWSNHITEIQKEYLERMNPIIQNSISDMNKNNIIAFNYISPVDVKNPVQIHILPYKKVYQNINPKLEQLDYHFEDNMSYFEEYLRGGVRFTPGLANQVDGYFLSDESNQIQLAVCYININNSDEIIKSYISECLLRATGLPEVIASQKGLLGERKQGELRHLIEEDIEVLQHLYLPTIKAGDDQYKAIGSILSIK